MGKDVDTIIRDLVESHQARARTRQMTLQRAKAEDAAEERLLDVLVPPRSEFGLALTTTPHRQHGTPGHAQAFARRRLG